MTGRFVARPTRFTGISEINGWRLKRYEITLDGSAIAADIITAVDRTLTSALPSASGDVQVGFVNVHYGAHQVWILADLWQGDIISQHTFHADLDQPTDFTPVAPGGPTACVWELAVHAHERDAFIRHVLNPSEGPRLDDYLTDTMTTSPSDNEDLVRAFNAAWSTADVEKLMGLMSDNPTYRASTGPSPGIEYHGRQQVQTGFSTVIEAEATTAAPPAPPSGEIIVMGDHALSKWSYTTTTTTGETVTIEGVDLWTFDNGRIAVKDAYRKSFPDLTR